VVADAARPDTWWNGQPYDRILLDAPCTASGVVRRHPDAPWLRRPDDVANLAKQQARMLEAVWPLLAPTGRLLYVVCSVFATEGRDQIASFLEQHVDARLVTLPDPARWGQQIRSCAQLPGTWELLPGLPSAPNTGSLPGDQGVADHDGFFYALLQKTP
jgi:16S rRNA (cytosine967-C5)-methyltransferase